MNTKSAPIAARSIYSKMQMKTIVSSSPLSSLSSSLSLSLPSSSFPLVQVQASMPRRSYSNLLLSSSTYPVSSCHILQERKGLNNEKISFASGWPSKYHRHHCFSSASDQQDDDETNDNKIRLSRIISNHGTNMQMSRKSAQSIITSGEVTIAGRVVVNPSLKLDLYGSDYDLCRAIKVAGRHFLLAPNPNGDINTAGVGAGAGAGADADADADADANDNKDEALHQSNMKHREENNNATTPNKNKNTQSQFKTRVWIAHKLRGELVAEHDPLGRPSLIERLYRGGVGKKTRNRTNSKNNHRAHLKPVGRLDMMTEGLILITNDGQYVHEMTLPSNALRRTYRARVHGRITHQKLNSIRRGVEINGMFYKGMDVQLELNKSLNRSKGGNTNTWLRITCTEGKNRMIRKVMDHLGLQVTRLIRVSFGDYDLNTIPPGLAIEVPVKPLDSQRQRGALKKRNNSKKQHLRKKQEKEASLNEEDVGEASPVQWIRH